MKKYLTCLIVLSIVLVLYACAPQPFVNTSDGKVSARLGEKVGLHVGQTAKFVDSVDQFGITLYHVDQDSRCPQGVACVWAGEVRIGLTFEENGLMHPPVLDMTTNPADPLNKRIIEGYLVEFVDMQPPSRAPGASIAQDEYIGTFLVTRAQATPTPPSNALTGAVRKFATSQTPTPIPTALDACGGLTRQDAEAMEGRRAGNGFAGYGKVCGFLFTLDR